MCLIHNGSRCHHGTLIKLLNKKLLNITSTEAEFKEFEPRLKYSWFHLKLYSMFQDLSRRSIETGFWRIWDATKIH